MGNVRQQIKKFGEKMRETNEKIYWICLSKIFGPANHHLHVLISECETAEEAYTKVINGGFPLTAWEKKQLSEAVYF